MSGTKTASFDEMVVEGEAPSLGAMDAPMEEGPFLDLGIWKLYASADQGTKSPAKSGLARIFFMGNFYQKL
jgi:hypothetical protein